MILARPSTVSTGVGTWASRQRKLSTERRRWRAASAWFLPNPSGCGDSAAQVSRHKHNRNARSGSAAPGVAVDTLLARHTIGGRGGAGGGLDEALEEPQRAFISVGDQFFRVALDGDNKAMVGDLDAFDHAIGGRCRDQHVAARRLDALMMEAVDHERLRAEQVGQARAGDDGDGVRAIVSRLTRISVLEAVGALRVNILIERAARGDVEQLQA